MRSDNASLACRFKQVLDEPETPLWFPRLSRVLAYCEWTRLREHGIDQTNYGTNRVLSKTPDVERLTILTVENSFEDAGTEKIHVEELSHAAWETIAKDAVPLRINEIDGPPVTVILNEAFGAIAAVSSLSDSVFALVRSIHLLRSDGLGEYDISFSEPHIPFSIFVSIPQRRSPYDFIRVAEGIIHEAMHLQLTLIEKKVSLISDASKKFYSPWRDELRPVHGVLHGLYVFGVLREFYGSLEKLDLFEKNIDLISDRQETIGKQIEQVKLFGFEPSLSDDGQALVRRILHPQENHRENPLP